MEKARLFIVNQGPSQGGFPVAPFSQKSGQGSYEDVG